MKWLSVQVQPDRMPGSAASAAITRLSKLVPDTEVRAGKDGGRYVNINMPAADPRSIWSAIHRLLQEDEPLAGAVIVVCQGEHGWDDYLLLHHFDAMEALDELE